MKKYIHIFFLIFCLLIFPIDSRAFQVVRNISAAVTGNFSIGPTKLEFSLNQGQTVEKELRVYNGTGKRYDFSVSFEGDSAPGVEIPFDKYVSADIKEFSLDHGEEAKIKIRVDVPPGNKLKFLSGAVLVKGNPSVGDNFGSQISTRLGSLIFIDIGKTAIRAGYVSSFLFNKDHFEVNFKNTGEAKLNPYGFIELSNFAGTVVQKEKIEPWFVLPDSEKKLIVNMERKSTLIPFYKARLVLYPGYGGPERTENILINIYDVKLILLYSVILSLLIFIFLRFKKYAKK